MTLDRDDIRAIAEEVARLLAPKLGVRQDPPETEEIPFPGSFAARRHEALAGLTRCRERQKAKEKKGRRLAE